MKKNYWMWNRGDFEIFHLNLVLSRREDYGMPYPPFWRFANIEQKVAFRCDFKCEKDAVLKFHLNGMGRILVDETYYAADEEFCLKSGEYKLTISVINFGGLPAVYSMGADCPDVSEWYTMNGNGEKTPVGYDVEYNSADKNPEVFKFEYERIEPVCCEEINGGKLFDFGKETFGYLYVDNADENKEILVNYGESREEALDIGEAILSEKISGKNSYKLKQRAFRYVFVTPCDDLEVYADYEYLPLEYKGSFVCDDEEINKIWEMCAYTLHLNTREVFLDGIKRDRWCWSGDAYQCFKFNNYLFFDDGIVKRTLTSLRGNDTVTEHINTITDYSMYWIISLYEYYMSFKDEEYIKAMYPKAKIMLDFMKTRKNEDGFITGKYIDWVFVDWSDIDKEGAVCAEQMLYIQSLIAMSAMAKLAGDEYKEYESEAAEYIEKVNRFYWSEEKGAFIDSYESGKNNVTRHANIFALMYDIATPAQREKIIKNVIENDEITHITTPYFEGYELDVMGKIGNFDYIENMMHSYWGEMLRLGATTVWEEFNPELKGIEHYAMYDMKYGKSLCHAWGASPVYLLGKYYLGVSPTKPGYEEFVVCPNTERFGFMKGTVPVNGGIVAVEVNNGHVSVTSTKDGGKLILNGREYKLTAGETVTI